MLSIEETKTESPRDVSTNNEMVPLQPLTSSPTPKQQPHSLVAKDKDHSKRDALISKCFNKFYDALTILISIADITTDIMVLISYYIAGRMTFFWISFVILITAQIGYLIVFFLSFDCYDLAQNLQKLFKRMCCGCNACKYIVECKCCSKCLDKNNKYVSCLSILFIFILVFITGSILFCCLLPFGHLVSFLMYFAENEESKFSVWLREKVGIEKRSNIPLEEHLSEMAKFTIDKINKHGGFILEAFLEALPQSILQLIAMVYFQQTNYIAVGSIILSMTSIMSKSLVISQGVEWKSYFFCWLCVCTDFFSIFFVVSWLFLSNQHVNGAFLGHFSVIGQVWCWIIIVAIIPPILFLAIAYFTVAMWLILYSIWKDYDDEKLWVQILMVFLYFTLGNAVMIAAYSVAAFIGCLFLQILCFTIIAVFIWIFFTVDRWEYTDRKIANVINKLLHFVSNASYKNNDRIIRILSINYAYLETDVLGKYIATRKKEETLHEVSYKDIRDHCRSPKKANIFQTGMYLYFGAFNEWKKECWDGFDWNYAYVHERISELLAGIAALLLLYISLPIYLLSRIITILYPYFIVIYLYYYSLWFKMNLFELIMLATYIFLQLNIFIFGFFVLRTHKWLWHIVPGVSSYDMRWSKDINPFLEKLYKFYDSIQWLPVIREIVFKKFGKDIGNIVIQYIIAINIDENQHKIYQ